VAGAGCDVTASSGAAGTDCNCAVPFGAPELGDVRFVGGTNSDAFDFNFDPFASGVVVDAVAAAGATPV
jgi:hypothetical protein